MQTNIGYLDWQFTKRSLRDDTNERKIYESFFIRKSHPKVRPEMSENMAFLGIASAKKIAKIPFLA